MLEQGTHPATTIPFLLRETYGMLISHDLSSRSFGLFVLTKSNERQVDCSLSSLFFPSFPRKDVDPRKIRDDS